MRQGESGGGGRESKTRWVSKLGRTIKRNNNRLLFKQRTAIVEHEREDNDELTFQLVERGITLEGRALFFSLLFETRSRRSRASC